MTRRFMPVVLPVMALGLALNALAGCGGSGGGGGGSSASSIKITGSLGSGITLASNESRLERMLRWFLPGRAYATGPTIDNVVSVDTAGNFILAIKSGSAFSLSLPQGNYYLIAFLSGTTVVATYVADTTVGTTGWTALPVSTASGDVDLGTVAINGAVATGTTSATAISTSLGLAPGLSSVLGVWDAAMQRLTNIDVDGDGIFDFQQGRRYDFTLHYEFNPGDTFAAIQGTAGTVSHASYAGYGYWFNATPAGSVNWACSTLTAPMQITSMGSPQDPSNSTCGNVQSNTQCFNNAFGGSGMSVNFYCGGGSSVGNLATAPATPPPGTYVVNADATHVYTFKNVSSQAIDTANLYNIYVPSAQLTMSGGQVTSLAVSWWKHDPTTGSWIQPTTKELAAIIGSVTYEFGAAGWAGNPAVDRVSGTIPVATSGSVAVSAQTTFTAGVLRITYTDAFGYGYGFEWR
jgi:hypothetical protein